MNIVTTRFGIVPSSDTEVIQIPEGLVGFRSHTRYVMLPDQEVAGLTWLQSVTAPELAFALVSPPLAIGDYQIELRPGDRAALELDDERSALIYVILNRGDGGGFTVNLQGPLIFNMARRIGRQLVLTSSRYAVRFPLGPDHHSDSRSGSGSPSNAHHHHHHVNQQNQNRAEPALLVGAGSSSTTATRAMVG